MRLAVVGAQRVPVPARACLACVKRDPDRARFPLISLQNARADALAQVGAMQGRGQRNLLCDPRGGFVVALVLELAEAGARRAEGALVQKARCGRGLGSSICRHCAGVCGRSKRITQLLAGHAWVQQA